ncbi:hypothetical protein [Evansella cellulosilytica]|uniref:DUF4367 domain-containing protein n=1 Tax=Evansella cellulosilytica (strain ATCC 21833 / DSM 2522 / FERM P-1141 / JCM 9156 / N-4) TaxID=649639 RepID=E6TUD2_EVAC2|nr:hypothetical protein [Evansella cellulosilytica]ADU29688.1 hypothetical protein Bcell_1425 [Evansella cellulosilytica DSM 2522]
MSQERFERGMEEIKFKYEKMPKTTSTNDIFQAIDVEKNKERRGFPLTRNIPMVAASIVFLLVATIFIGSYLSQNELSQSGELNTRDNSIVSGNNGDGNTHSDATPPVNNEGEQKSGEEEREETETVSTLSNRESSFTETIYPEGIESEINYELYVNEDLGFSTYVVPEFGWDEQVLSVYEANDTVRFFEEISYMGDFYFSVTRRENINNLNAVLEELYYQYEIDGYVEYTQLENTIFENVDAEGLWLKDEESSKRYYAIRQHEGDTYIIEMQVYISAGETAQGYAMRTFVNQMMFE